MIRLLMVTDTYFGGQAGSERYLQKLATRLDPNEFAMDILQLSSKQSMPFATGPLPGHSNINILRAPVGRIYGPSGLYAIRYCCKLLKDNVYDIVQSVHEKSDILNAMLPVAGQRPVKLSSRRDLGFKLSHRLRLVSGLVNRRIDWMIAPSEATAKFLLTQKGTAESRVQVINNGVDPDVFAQRTAESIRTARAKLNIGHGVFCIGMVANLKPVKGHNIVIQAVQMLVSSGRRNIHLVLIGEGELRAELECLVENLGLSEHVQMVGQCKHVSEVLGAFDVVVSASYSEGMSNALIEAAAVGIPVVATDVGGNPEVVSSEETGFLFEGGDAEELSRLLRTLLDDPCLRTNMGVRAREYALQKFGLCSMVQQHAEFYRQVIASGRTDVVEYQ